MSIPTEITVQMIKGAFASTTVRSRVTLEEGLCDHKGEKLNTLYEIFELLDDFGTLLLSSDGGVRDFIIFYNLNKSLIFIDRFPIGEKYDDINNPTAFVNHLNEQISKHILNAKLLVKELDYNETISRFTEEHSRQW